MLNVFFLDWLNRNYMFFFPGEWMGLLRNSPGFLFIFIISCRESQQMWVCLKMGYLPIHRISSWFIIIVHHCPFWNVSWMLAYRRLYYIIMLYSFPFIRGHYLSWFTNIWLITFDNHGYIINVIIYPYQPYINNHNDNQEYDCFHNIWDVILPIDELHHFSEG